jgi:flagellar protein FliS
MFGTTKRGVNAYANVGLETSVASASPHKLIVMLYDGALVAVMSALMHMKAGNIPEKGKSISHAITIIDSGLRASLDKSAGGEIAEGLDALYITTLPHWKKCSACWPTCVKPGTPSVPPPRP